MAGLPARRHSARLGRFTAGLLLEAGAMSGHRSSACCQHCGLPVIGPATRRGGAVFCCYGCYLVSRIVGPQAGQGRHAWAVLRLAVGAFLSMNVMMVSLLLYTGAAEPPDRRFFEWVMLAVSAPAMALLGYPFALGAAAELRRGRLSLDSLIFVGSFAAFFVSAANTMRSAGHVYYDTATMLPALVTFGKLIEATAKTRAGELLKSLESLLPGRALRVQGDGQAEVPLAALKVGDLVRVRPGERLAVDGVVVEGATTIQEAAFTGESSPRRCDVGDQVYAGTVNGAGGVVVRAVQVSGQLLLERIAQAAGQAQRRPSPIERLARRAAAAFTPAVLALAAGAGVWHGVTEGASAAAMAALAVLVVACPCAMGIAAPLATALAIARAARAGALVRGGEVLEQLGKLKTVMLDKTGTLTTGRAGVVAVQTRPDGSADELLALLAGLESAGEHHIGKAIVDEAARRGLAVGAASAVSAVPGCGITGTVTAGGATRRLAAGTWDFVTRELGGAGGVAPTGQAAAFAPTGTGDADNRNAWVAAHDAATHPTGAEAATAVFVAWDGQLRGRVLLADAPRPEAAQVVRELAGLGVQTVLLSGDAAEVAQDAARQVGIQRVLAPRRPDEKIDEIRAAGKAGLVGMVGDGINDAPALATADIGMALGAGTDLARQAGNVVLLGEQLSQIPWLIRLSRRARRIIVQNLAWALGYNAIALAAAAAGMLHPLLAAVAMVLSSLTVLSNSVRLQRFP
jgi:heavy metal translocating P-type ATPase